MQDTLAPVILRCKEMSFPSPIIREHDTSRVRTISWIGIKDENGVNSKLYLKDNVDFGVEFYSAIWHCIEEDEYSSNQYKLEKIMAEYVIHAVASYRVSDADFVSEFESITIKTAHGRVTIRESAEFSGMLDVEVV